MKSPEGMTLEMLAPCGVNCLVCYRHAAPSNKKALCLGCLGPDQVKAASCRHCAIRACAAVERVRFCAECKAFPCARIKRLDKTYRTRYGVSLVEQGRYALGKDVESFWKKHQGISTCSCGGLICLQDKRCTECGKVVEA